MANLPKKILCKLFIVNKKLVNYYHFMYLDIVSENKVGQIVINKTKFNVPQQI